jgi:hypothetical protein
MATPRLRLRGALPLVALLLSMAAFAVVGSSGAGGAALATDAAAAEVAPSAYAGRRSDCEYTPATKPRWDETLKKNRIGSRRGKMVCGTAKADLITAVGGNEVLARQGNDEIHAANEIKDHIDAGAGRDTVYADKCDRVAFAETVERTDGQCREVRSERQSGLALARQ